MMLSCSCVTHGFVYPFGRIVFFSVASTPEQKPALWIEEQIAQDAIAPLYSSIWKNVFSLTWTNLNLFAHMLKYEHPEPEILASVALMDTCPHPRPFLYIKQIVGVVGIVQVWLGIH